MNSLRFAIRGLIFTVLLYGFSSYLTTKHWIFPSPIFDFLIVGIVFYALILVRKEVNKNGKTISLCLLAHAVINLFTSPWIYTFVTSNETTEWLIQSHTIELIQLLAGISLSVSIYLIFTNHAKIISISLCILSLILMFVVLYKFQYFAIFMALFVLNRKQRDTENKGITSIFGFMSFLFLCEIVNNLM